jgi:hypothetical protein
MKGFIFISFYGGIVLLVVAAELFVRNRVIAAIAVAIFAILLVWFALSFWWSVIINVTTMERSVLGITGDEHQRWRNFRELFDGFWGVFLPTRPKISGFAWSGAEVAEKIERMARVRKSTMNRMDQPLLSGAQHTIA